MARNVSNEFKNVIANGGPFYAYAEILLQDGTQLTITSEDDLLVDGNEIQESGGDGFPLGVALSRTLNMSIDNTDDRYSDYDFYYARITMYTEIDLSSGGVERLKEGTFTVTEPVSPGDEIDFTAYDDMYKAAKIYVPKVSFPATALDVLHDVCSQCDINLGSATFLNSDFQIPSIPENLTCRQVIGYIAMIAVGNAVFDENNRLLIKSYNFSLIESFPIISGGKYDEEIDETISGGVLTDDMQNVMTGGEFGDESEMAVLSEFSSDPEISTDDVVITGIRMESLDSDIDEVYVYGTEDYALTVQNELVSGKEQELIQMIGDRVIGVSIRPFSGKFFPNPSIQFMDFVFLVDRKSNTYTTFIANNTFSYLKDSEYSNELESPIRNNSQYYSEITEVYRKAREEAQKQKSEWEKAMEELSDRVNNSSGLYMTSEEQPDGSSIYYMHDKPTLEESMIVWKMTAEAMAVSTDGGKTYNAGLTVDGTLIANIMNTIGINFDWGVGGSLVIKDSDGNINFMADANTGQVYISPSALGYDEDKDLILNGNFEDGSSENWTFNTGKIVRSGTIYCANLSYSDSFVGSRPILQQSLKNAIPGTYRLSFRARLVANTEGATIRTTLGKSYEHSFTGFTQAFKDFTYDFQITKENIVAGSINLTFQNTSDSYCEIYVTGIMLYPPLVESLKNNISITAEGLSAEIERAKSAEESLSTNLSLTAEGLSLEIERATGEEEVLRSSIEANAQQIKLKVSAGDVESIIEQNADSIRLKAGKISWESTYSSMTENGQLTCTSAEIKGIFRSEQKNSWGTEYIQIRDAIISGGVDSAEYGLLDLAAQYGDGVKHVSLSCLEGTVNVRGKTLSFETVDNTGEIILGGKVSCIYGFNGLLAVNANMNYTIKVEGGIITGWY